MPSGEKRLRRRDNIPNYDILDRVRREGIFCKNKHKGKKTGYGAAHGYAPDYILNLVTLTSATSGWSPHLRSADSLTFDILGRGQGLAIITLGRWSTRLERTHCWHSLCTQSGHF